MTAFKQNKVSQATWPWTNSDKSGAPDKRMSRPMKALIQTGVMLVLAFVFYRFLDKLVMSRIILGIAGVVLVSGLAIPPVFDAIERFGKWLGHILGTGVTWLVLVPFYYLCFVPGRVILRMQGKDPMHREFPTDAETYWIARPRVRSSDQYKKQH
ncbi:MAG: hypothetical protein KJ626_00650 [Verrucomicrobia bacterium]|nr:hypothetical protein [Verrucomicrobiota bacterium]